jgi:hypothetical protein
VTGVTVTPTARAAAPTNFTLTPTAGGNFQAGNDEFYLLGAIVGGVMSDLAGPVSFTTDDVNKSAQLNWDAYPGASALVLFSAVKSHFLQFAKVLLAGGATSYLDTYVMPNQDPEWRSPNSPWFLDYRINVTWYVEALLSDGTYSEPGVSSVLVIAPISREYDIYNTQVSWTAHASAVGYRLTRFVSLYSFGGGRFDLQVNVPATQLSYLDSGNSTYAIPPGFSGDAAGIVRPIAGRARATRPFR